MCALDSDEFKADVERFAGICAVVKAMRTARIGQIGSRVMPFRTVRYSEKLLQRSGITVETEDFSEILASIEKLSDDAAIEAKINEIEAYGNVCPGTEREKLYKQAKLCIVIETGCRTTSARPALSNAGTALRPITAAPRAW